MESLLEDSFEALPSNTKGNSSMGNLKARDVTWTSSTTHLTKESSFLGSLKERVLIALKH